MKKCCIIAGAPENLCVFENTAECDGLFERIKEHLLKAAANNESVRVITSMNRGAETVAAEAVLLTREQTGFELECALPYEAQAENWSEAERDRYFGIVAQCDKETLVSRRYTAGCEADCRTYTVNESDYIILCGEPSPADAEIIRLSGKPTVTL